MKSTNFSSIFFKSEIYSNIISRSSEDIFLPKSIKTIKISLTTASCLCSSIQFFQIIKSKSFENEFSLISNSINGVVLEIISGFESEKMYSIIYSSNIHLHIIVLLDERSQYYLNF